MATCPIVALYRGGPDAYGRTLDQIRGWDHESLEDIHDFIQFLFPTRQPSGVNSDAPLVTDATVAAFHADPALRAELAHSLAVMLDFYGLQTDPSSGRVTKADNFATRAENWLDAPNHNFLRLTRILTCLRLLGLPDRATALLACLEEIHQERPGLFGRSIEFWRAAVR